MHPQNCSPYSRLKYPSTSGAAEPTRPLTCGTPAAAPATTTGAAADAADAATLPRGIATSTAVVWAASEACVGGGAETAEEGRATEAEAGRSGRSAAVVTTDAAGVRPIG